LLDEEKDNLFQTFEGVMMSAAKEKMQMPQYKKKLEKSVIKVNFRLQIAQDEYFETNLVLQGDQSSFNKGRLDDFDIEILAAPEDLMWFSANTRNTVHMITHKNQFGKKKMIIKNGFHKISKLLLVSKVLVFG
jgi:hypothetical protein